ncbi:DUF4179 domain-containing protein [Clostridium brassicae]|uniref:DUF4179 domain-containing protein n=1 Tax=Clostridium brassicae TaxID=2999072 RepID=A0ABT4DBI2_9CLOT|nr:DUF4179 domain-containing protein [Clostridium brassicae]MCY6958516.1 DUF4179 domain-containing protein [Clostridium brassicae]
MNNEVFDREFTSQFGSYKPEIPHGVLERIDRTLACLPEKEVVGRNRKHRFAINKILKHSIVAATIAITVLTVSATVSPSIANALTNIPVVGSVFKLFGDMGLKLANDKGISTLVDKTKIDKDIKVTITDILFDGSRISIGYNVEANNLGEIGKPNLLVNGKPIDFSMSTYGSPLTENSYAGVMNINPTSELPKHFKLTVSFNKIGTIEGNWKFENIEVKNQANMLNGKLITPMLTKSLSGGKSITIEKIFMSDSTIKLHAIETNIPKGTFYDYQLIDNYGNVLEPTGGSGHEENGIDNKEYTFIPWNNNPQQFVVKVLEDKIVSGRTLKDIKTDVKGNFPVTISQGEGGEISLNKIEYLNNKTLVHYIYKGNDPYGNGMCVWVEDEKGNELDNPQKATKRNIDGSYILECFPIDKNKKIKIATRELPDIKSILEFEIPLK